VEYARKRFITVIPEIEMPGHALAALASYPELSCSGGPFDVMTRWGIFRDVYCAKDETFSFLEDVLTEVIDLFPSKYIHIGGDECPKVRWKRCKACQDQMQKNGLKNEEELQSYFITRIEKFLNSKGREIIGWDEILEGGLAPNATVMSWRGIKGGIEAAKQHHNVIMTPGNPLYFDHYQAKTGEVQQPLAIGGYNPIDSVYAYNPVPKELTSEQAKYIIGAQANVWTEFIPTEAQVEYMVFPRISALAETVWTPLEQKDLEKFKQRLEKHKERYAIQGIRYFGK
jgi:hexosaminidase